MSQIVDVARRLGSNLARAARRGLAHTTLPRDGGMWLEVHLTPPMEDLPAPRLPFAREGGTSLLEVLETLDEGTLITGYSTKGSWLRVATREGRSGWIHLSLVSQT